MNTNEKMYVTFQKVYDTIRSLCTFNNTVGGEHAVMYWNATTLEISAMKDAEETACLVWTLNSITDIVYSSWTTTNSFVVFYSMVDLSCVLGMTPDEEEKIMLHTEANSHVMTIEYTCFLMGKPPITACKYKIQPECTSKGNKDV